MRSSTAWPSGALLLLVMVVLAGCGGPEEVVIDPLPAEQGGTDLGLGPGVKPLSSGPGDKNSPRWGPGDDRIAYVVDGYVVDKPLYTRDLRRWTTKDFGAEEIEWVDDGLTILGQDEPAAGGVDHSHEEKENPAGHTVYRTLPEEGSLDVADVVDEVLTIGPGPQGNSLMVALQTGKFGSNLVLVGDDGRVERAYTEPVGGRVTGFSVSPEGNRAVLSVQGAATFALYVFDLSGGAARTLTRLEPGTKIYGAPQWTRHGIYYVAGKEAASEGDGASLYSLYRVAPGSDVPEPVSGTGEGFVAASLRASPDGERLALVGRRNLTSPANVYVLDLASGELATVTANEDMEIKTGPEDLAWSSSGESLAIVARGTISEPRVRAAPADSLVTDFYNVYEVPVATPEDG